MPAYNDKSKVSIYKWREANKDVYNEYMNVKSTAYYASNRDMIREKKRLRYVYLKECAIFRNILI